MFCLLLNTVLFKMTFSAFVAKTLKDAERLSVNVSPLRFYCSCLSAAHWVFFFCFVFAGRQKALPSHSLQPLQFAVVSRQISSPRGSAPIRERPSHQAASHTGHHLATTRRPWKATQQGGVGFWEPVAGMVSSRSRVFARGFCGVVKLKGILAYKDSPRFLARYTTCPPIL